MKTSLKQRGILQANSVLIVSGFKPKLVSGSETRARSGVHKGVESHLHTHTSFSASLTLPALAPSLPPVRRRCLSLPPTPFLSLPSDWLTEQPTSFSPPLPPSFQKNLRHTSESPNSITIASVTIIIHCGTTTKSSVFKRKSPLKISGGELAGSYCIHLPPLIQ